MLIACGEIERIGVKDSNVSCRNCKGRIFYKKRVYRPNTYEAR